MPCFAWALGTLARSTKYHTTIEVENKSLERRRRCASVCATELATTYAFHDVKEEPQKAASQSTEGSIDKKIYIYKIVNKDTDKSRDSIRDTRNGWRKKRAHSSYRIHCATDISVCRSRTRSLELIM